MKIKIFTQYLKILEYIHIQIFQYRKYSYSLLFWIWIYSYRRYPITNGNKQDFLCYFDISMEQRKNFFCWFWLILLLCFDQNQQKSSSHAKTSYPSKKQLYRSKLFLWFSCSYSKCQFKGVFFNGPHSFAKYFFPPNFSFVFCKNFGKNLLFKRVNLLCKGVFAFLTGGRRKFKKIKDGRIS